MVLSKPADAPVQKLFDLSGKVVAITGGARGIGLAVATAYAEAGAKIAILYRTTTSAQDTAYELAAKYETQTGSYQVDVTIPQQIEAAINQIVDDFGKLDVVVTNAGISSEHAAEEYTPEEFQRIMDVNVNGAFYTARAAAEVFKEQGFGNVVFTASISATLVNIPQRQAAYNASKAAVMQLTKSLAVEWVEFCRVNCVSPGYVQTKMIEHTPKATRDKWLSQIPARRFACPYELKGVYLFCASDASSYMTGSNLIVDGGFSLP